MGKPTLIYFNVTGRAETVRLAFHIGGIDFEDKRITGEELAKMKPELPFGCVPVLKLEDGQYVSQSVALLIYAGTLAKLVPSDDTVKLLKVLEVVLGYEDVIALLGPSLKEKDPEKQKEMRKALVEGKLPEMLQCMEKVVSRHGKNGFMVGDSLTIADLTNYNIMLWFKSGALDFADKYAKLQEGFKLVSNLPKVKEWREKHP